MKKRTHLNHWTDKEVEDHWDRVASIYVSENEKVKEAHDQRFRESILNLDIAADSKVLNVTSRDCEATDYILREQPKARVVNAEISQGLMDVAARLRPLLVQVKIETYSKLPFENDTFNRVLSLETLEHVADPVAFLNELHRVSTEHAILVLSCPPATSEIPYRVFTALFGGHGEGPHRFLRSGEVKEMFKKTGWKLRLHKGTVLIPLGPVALQRFGEKIISKFQKTFISELGIRQFYVCEKH